jgi:hypothetical protein
VLRGVIACSGWVLASGRRGQIVQNAAKKDVTLPVTLVEEVAGG